MTATCGVDAAIRRSSSTETGKASMPSFTSTGVESPLKMPLQVINYQVIGFKKFNSYWCCWRLKPCLLFAIKGHGNLIQMFNIFLFKFIPHYFLPRNFIVKVWWNAPTLFCLFLIILVYMVHSDTNSFITFIHRIHSIFSSLPSAQ